jgi:hypothetical protein
MKSYYLQNTSGDLIQQVADFIGKEIRCQFIETIIE